MKKNKSKQKFISNFYNDAPIGQLLILELIT